MRNEPKYTPDDFLRTHFVKGAKLKVKPLFVSKTCPIMKEERKKNNEKP